ncbi:MAG: DUF167 domain-containing protein [Verrucomicrobiales bacterium]|nr:DUF167 domain-containing protein [Verrucomicrobiales bacterium]
MARFLVKVVPNARQTALLGPVAVADGETALAIRLQAPPVDGKANEALTACLADAFGVPKRAIRIVRGTKDRLKLVEIDGLDEAALRVWFQKPASGDRE